MDDALTSSSEEWTLLEEVDKICDQPLQEEFQAENAELESRKTPDFTDLSSPATHIEVSEIKDEKIENAFTSDEQKAENTVDQVLPDNEVLSTVRCYKHFRNEQLNFILNLILALALASTVGLGIGYFLGWSEKCNLEELRHMKLPDVLKSSEEKLTNSILEVDVPKQYKSTFTISVNEKSFEVLLVSGKGNNTVAKKEWDEQCSGYKNMLTSREMVEKSISLPAINQEATSKQVNFSKDAYLTRQLGRIKVVNQNISSDFIITLNKFSNNKSHHSDIKRTSITKKTSNSSVLSDKSILEVKQKFKNNKLIIHLRKDLDVIIQSLHDAAIEYIYNKSAVQNAELVNQIELISYMYENFKNHVNDKISDLESFVQNPVFEKFKRSNFNLFQDMFYSLINTVDNLFKTTVKTFNKDVKGVRIEKFLKETKKSIAILDKRWVKTKKVWLKNIDKMTNYDVAKRNFNRSPKYLKKNGSYSEKEKHKDRVSHKNFKTISIKASK